MEIEELRMLLDLNVGNEKAILEKHAQRVYNGSFIFVDNHGKCWPFDENGKLGDGKIKNIGQWAFSNRKLLTSIEIPDSVKSIGYGAFKYCTSLKSIKIPNSVKSIGYEAFYGCTSLKSIEIPNSVESIGFSAFCSCTSLKSIEIPNLVKSIGFDVFWNCTSLKSIVFKGKTREQVKAMNYYPWGIKNESIIKVA